jgi:hypothetical protein
MSMNVGDMVKVTQCEQCSAVVGKIALVSKVNTEGEQAVSVELNFGRGRPQKNRPKVFGPDDVSLVEQ